MALRFLNLGVPTPKKSVTFENTVNFHIKSSQEGTGKGKFMMFYLLVWGESMPNVLCRRMHKYL